jgi:hypothetical protein
MGQIEEKTTPSRNESGEPAKRKNRKRIYGAIAESAEDTEKRRGKREL